MDGEKAKSVKPAEGINDELKKEFSESSPLHSRSREIDETKNRQEESSRELEKRSKAEAAESERQFVNSIQNQFEEEKLNRLKGDNEARRNFSNAIFAMTVIWMFLILMIIFQTGNGLLNLSDTVLVTLVTTATANVFGFFYVVVNYLFNKDKST